LLAGYEFLALLVAAGCCWLEFFVLVAGRLLLAGIFCVGCWQAGIFGIGCLVGLFGAGAWR
jgi:hypothetical protein